MRDGVSQAASLVEALGKFGHIIATVVRPHRLNQPGKARGGEKWCVRPFRWSRLTNRKKSQK